MNHTPVQYVRAVRRTLADGTHNEGRPLGRVHILRDDQGGKTYCGANLAAPAKVEAGDVAPSETCSTCLMMRTTWLARRGKARKGKAPR